MHFLSFALDIIPNAKEMYMNILCIFFSLFVSKLDILGVIFKYNIIFFSKL